MELFFFYVKVDGINSNMTIPIRYHVSSRHEGVVTLPIFSLWIAEIQLNFRELASLCHFPGFYFGIILLRVWFPIVIARIIQMPCLFIIYALMDVIPFIITCKLPKYLGKWRTSYTLPNYGCYVYHQYLFSKRDFSSVWQNTFKYRMSSVIRRRYHSVPL